MAGSASSVLLEGLGITRDGSGRHWYTPAITAVRMQMDVNNQSQIQAVAVYIVQATDRVNIAEDIAAIEAIMKRLTRNGFPIDVMLQQTPRPPAFWQVREDLMDALKREQTENPGVVNAISMHEITQAFARVFGSDGDENRRYVFTADVHLPDDGPACASGPRHLSRSDPRPPARGPTQALLQLLARLELLMD